MQRNPKYGYLRQDPFRSPPAPHQTSNDPAYQIWQELVLLRHLKTGKHKARKVTSPWIDQAQVYFLDAHNSDWRSGGLLYYYSFLNLAKALSVMLGPLSFRSLDANPIYHGLSADLQTVKSIVDFQIVIHPPTHRGKKNLFPFFYQTLLNANWPFDEQITISLSDILPYVLELGSENERILNLGPRLFPSQSVVRQFEEGLTFDILTHPRIAAQIRRDYSDRFPTVLDGQSMVTQDIDLWRRAYDRETREIRSSAILRSRLFKSDELSKLISTVAVTLRGLAYPSPTFSHSFPHWIFCEKLRIQRSQILWDPLLSEYLSAFALGSILRYQPQLLKDKSLDSYIAQAWCSQSSMTALRFFLARFTEPAIIIEHV